MTEAPHVVAIGLGSNLGDRTGNIAGALMRLRAFLRIERVSSAYLTKPVGYLDQPDFLNVACVGTTDASYRELRDALRRVERDLGRRTPLPLGPRAIDLDLLLYDDAVVREQDLTIPHPGLATRAFVLVPLAEIAPDMTDPASGKRIAELAAAVDRSGVKLFEAGLLTRIRRDVQESRPSVPLSLNRAGVLGVKTVVELNGRASSGRPRSTSTTIVTFDIYADLDARRSGVHMSRFSQDLEDALGDLSRQPAASMDELVLALAERVVESQHAERAEVDARAEVALLRHTPVSGLPTHEFFTALARAVVAKGFRRRLVGVQAEGLMACPCAQSMVGEYSRDRLLAEGFDEDQIGRVLATVPIATHNQRGRGTLLLGTDARVDLETLVEIIEQSMSAETYDVLKRPDELFVVNKAHFAPRFVEDAVREMLRYAHDAFDELPDAAFVFARQVNFESIHKHDAVAESCATLGELRRELHGESAVRHTTLEEWLYPKGVEVDLGRP